MIISLKNVGGYISQWVLNAKCKHAVGKQWNNNKFLLENENLGQFKIPWVLLVTWKVYFVIIKIVKEKYKLPVHIINNIWYTFSN